MNAVAPMERFQCKKCERIRLQPVSLLRPAILAGLLLGLVFTLHPLSSSRPGSPASTLTEIRLDALKPVSTDQDDLDTTIVEADEPAGVFLGEGGETTAITTVSGSSGDTSSIPETSQTAATEARQEPDEIVEVFATIMRADSGNFTIQVASAGTWVEADTMMVKLSKRYNLNDEFFVYRSQAGGKLLFPVLYGNFVSSSQAKAAIADLPGHLRAGQPFVRKFGTVQRMLAQVSG